MLLIPLKDTRPPSAEDLYDHAWLLYQGGSLAAGQQEADFGYKRFENSDPRWAAKFLLLEAEAMLRRGMKSEALHLVDGYQRGFNDPEQAIRRLAIEAEALAQQQASAADERLTEAEALCKLADYRSCGGVIRVRSILAFGQGQVDEARQYLLKYLLFAKAHHDKWAEVGANNNLGYIDMQLGRFDEAVERLKSAQRGATEVSSHYWEQLAEGNLGWAYYQLGDDEKALPLFLAAKRDAEAIGGFRDELKWINDAGNVYRDTGDLPRATQSYRDALDLAGRAKNQDGVVHALEELAQLSAMAEKWDEASKYISQVTPMELAGGKQLSTYLTLTEGMVAAGRREDQEAESLFRAIEEDPGNPTMMRLGASDELASLLERQGNTKKAEQVLKDTLAEFEAARSKLNKEESSLPYVANAAYIYADYIHLLVQQGRVEEALVLADQSRARTLAQGLGAADMVSFQREGLKPRKIAEKTGATLFFYWLGEKQSYLWAITPEKIGLFPLPAQAEITARIQRYRNALVDLQDSLQSGNEDGRALYQMLIAPAAGFVRANRPVMILADGDLNLLNFETLLAPGPGPQPDLSSGRTQGLHYWIDDATVLSAPSLAMLAAANPAPSLARSLLLVGNPISPSEDFPSLPLFGFEMKSIQSHFDRDKAAVFAGKEATPEAYLSSYPARYSYIHFVSHAVSSRTDPLDSAIILSGKGAGPDSFKLYARDIMRRPIHARLVTIAACSASGTRAYAGEGLVGLSWAFLRAGAQSVIGALWEVSDDSSPRLMNTLYQGLESGQTPETALRGAKLVLLHSDSRFRLPFYWAPFQIYTRR